MHLSFNILPAQRLVQAYAEIKIFIHFAKITLHQSAKVVFASPTFLCANTFP